MLSGGGSGKTDSLFGLKKVATGSKVEAKKAELNALQQGFADRAKQEKKRFEDATDSEFWFCMCFNTREQKEAFLEQIGWDTNGADKYVDGVDVARQVGLKLPASPIRREPRIDKTFLKLT